LPVRVLIVEDVALLAMELAAIVEEMGCTVVGPVGQLTRALAEADAGVLDAALLDLNLHGQSSEKVAILLAARGIPLAFVTAYSPAVKASAFGHRPIVQKPFQPADIQNVLRKLLPGKL
jgi:CheY-like chemotaxis protein